LPAARQAAWLPRVLVAIPSFKTLTLPPATLG
jgi:hypothetical protein